MYSLTDGHVQTGGGIDRGVFLHEFAHNLYYAPHQLGANGTCGNHFDSSQGWGMMCGITTSFSANAWERWYNGWTELKTGAGQVNSDIVDATSLTATNGVYTLRDYVTTGDVMRLKIPNTGQYLWLENRAKNGPFDRRHDQTWQYGGDYVAFPPAPVGLLAMVESLSGRTVPITYNDIFNPSKVSQLRPVSAQGNSDYVANGPPASYNRHFWDNLLYNFTPSLNASGGVSEITNIRLDKDGNNIIRYAGGHGNGDLGAGNEMTWMEVAGGQFRDGTFGPNLGTRTVGFRYGIASNPLLTGNPVYDATTQQSGDLALSGLSVQITAYDAGTGDLTLQVRYNDTQLRANTRWTGQLRTFPVANATNGAEISVYNGVRLTLDRGLTPQRSDRNTNGDFVNETRLTIGAGTRLKVESTGNIDLQGQGTTLYVEQGGSVYQSSGGKLTAYPGTTISLQNRADLSGSGELKAGAKLVVRSTTTTIQGPYVW